MAKSATLHASVPYFPLTPTPTSAAVIMLTSLAPSPIARVKSGVCSLTYFTTFYFWTGVQR